MNLWFRLLWLLLTARFRAKLDLPEDVSRLRFRVWFNDLDTNRHVNNGRYWTLFDLGRTDLILRSGMMGQVLKNSWMPVISTGGIRFRRELKLFQPFTLETQIVHWKDSHIVIEHRLVTEDGTVATRAQVLGGFYDRKNRRFVSAEQVMSVTGKNDLQSPPPDAAAQALLDMASALRADPER